MRRVISMILHLALVGWTAASAAAESGPPNVVFIVADDLNVRLGAYGDLQARTPHIDRLARAGVRFDRAYTQFPHCNPSRASFLTGQRPDKTGVSDLVTHFRKNLPDVVTLPQHFRQKGYFVARVGKIFHQMVPADLGTKGLDDDPSWDVALDPRGWDADVKQLANVGKGGFPHLASTTAPAGEHTDEKVATEALRLIGENAGKRPFFVAVGFYRPHLPWIAPKRLFDRFPALRMRPPTVPADDDADLPAPARNGAVASYFHQPTPAERQRILQAYYASVALIDEQVGRLMDDLRRRKLLDRTIVVFTSDHGYHLGEHNLWHKRSLFETSARVPLIIAAPGARPHRVRSLVELVDLYPTLADLAGLPVPADLAGVSLRPLLFGPDKPVKEAAFSQALRGEHLGRSIRTDRYRYIEWDDGAAGVELYDEHRDPEEWRNLAGHRAAAQIQADMKAKLAAARGLPPPSPSADAPEAPQVQ